MHGEDDQRIQEQRNQEGETGRAPARRATLATVAKLSGYHVSTVSRVLNGSTVPGVRSASSATAEHIRQVAREVGYVPNAQAAALRRQRTRLLGVVMARMADTVLATIYEGIERAAAGYGFQTLVTNSWDDPVTRGECVDVLLSHGVDAMILGDSPVDGGSLDVLTEHGLPFVLVNRRAADHPAITCDDYAGGRMAAEHLLELGHRRAAVLAGLPYASNAIERTQGFLDAYQEAGHRIPGGRIVQTTFDTAGGRMGAERLLRARSKPTAIFAVNDAAAIGVLGCLRDHGIEPGRELSVVGFNDIPLAAELTVPLTSVRSPMQAIGEHSVHTLMRLMGGESVQSMRLRPALVARASSGPR
ncbi:LacI family DNA-binding transcriptional regulator [Amycolatopsis aidingensis]|uniref:LacI family DNA-binding transcriptional regulator n=1 Tax=Amycolatopsis aidingensis TaxID=2842453 RepID=UPI001E493BBD|nr:LacI family DNA-binding transcriptional regulator [Amycolatopsis aidingensis]